MKIILSQGIKYTILLISLGSIGKRHLQNLRQLDENANIIVLRNSKNFKKSNIENITEVFTMEEALSFKPGIAIIASPAVFHIEQALTLLSNNVHLFIEKPLSHNLDGIHQVINIAKEKSLIVMVGYVLRFSPILKKIKSLVEQKIIGKIINVNAHCGQYLPDWRPNKNYRNTVSAKESLGGGVLLELSHEFDYLRWIFGDVKAVVSNVKNTQTLDIDVEDMADVLLKFNNNITAFVHLDFLQKKTSRVLSVYGLEGNICCDLINGIIDINTINGNTNLNLSQEINDLYLDELEYFLKCIEEKTLPFITLDDGLKAVKVVEAIKESSIKRQWINL